MNDRKYTEYERNAFLIDEEVAGMNNEIILKEMKMKKSLADLQLMFKPKVVKLPEVFGPHNCPMNFLEFELKIQEVFDEEGPDGGVELEQEILFAKDAGEISKREAYLLFCEFKEKFEWYKDSWLEQHNG